MMIEPSATPQSVGLVEATFVICGPAGASKITGLPASNTVQVPSTFLTAIL
jgi:hypothetical protein